MLDPLRVRDFEFDMGNLPHLMKRHIQPADVWEVFFSDPVFIEDASSGSGDWRMVAPVPGGFLTIVLTESKGADETVARPITGWPSERWEIEVYEREA